MKWSWFFLDQKVCDLDIVWGQGYVGWQSRHAVLLGTAGFVLGLVVVDVEEEGSLEFIIGIDVPGWEGRMNGFTLLQQT